MSTISEKGLAVIFAGYPFLVWSKVLIIFLALVFDTLQFREYTCLFFIYKHGVWKAKRQ